MDNCEDVILDYLRHIEAKVDNLQEDMREVGNCLTGIEAELAYLVRDWRGVLSARVELQTRLGHMEKQIDG